MKNTYLRKTFALLCALCMIMTGVALAEEEKSAAIICEIENGSYVIRIPVEEDDQGWYADEMSEDDTVVRLSKAQIEDGCFVVQYDPVGDGEATVSVRHYYCAVACDQAMTWDLAVEDGKIIENVGGSYTASPMEEEQDAFLSGEWLEKDTQFTKMRIEKNEAMGWDVEITSPVSHGAYIFIATVYYDCYEDGFLYDKGKLYDLPLDGQERGEPVEAGALGGLKLDAVDDETFNLIWIRSDAPDEIIAFERCN